MTAFTLRVHHRVTASEGTMIRVEKQILDESASEKGRDNWSDVFGPQQVDQAIRQAIQFCWLCLPKKKRSVDQLEKQIQRIVDRALRDFRKDLKAFGKPTKSKSKRRASK